MNRMIETLSSEELERVDQVIIKYRGKQGSLIPALKESQDICGYLPKQVQRRIAEGLSLSPSQVYGVVSFYAFFTTVPRGRHIIRVCLGTACYVKGVEDIMQAVEKEFKVKRGETTRDRKLSLFVTRCIGACAMAPNIVVDDEVIGKATKEMAIEKIKLALKGGPKRESS